MSYCACPATFRDLNATAFTIKDSDQHDRIALFDCFACCKCRFFATERTFGLSIHSQDKTLLRRRDCLGRGALSSRLDRFI
jgi:hypothetical protein